jgi:hypothetical protein
LSLLNYFFDWHLGLYETEVPGEPDFAGIILILGLVVSAVGYYLNKKASV